MAEKDYLNTMTILTLWFVKVKTENAKIIQLSGILNNYQKS